MAFVTFQGAAFADSNNGADLTTSGIYTSKKLFLLKHTFKHVTVF